MQALYGCIPWLSSSELLQWVIQETKVDGKTYSNQLAELRLLLARERNLISATVPSRGALETFDHNVQSINDRMRALYRAARCTVAYLLAKGQVAGFGLRDGASPLPVHISPDQWSDLTLHYDSESALGLQGEYTRLRFFIWEQLDEEAAAAAITLTALQGGNHSIE